MVIKNLFGEFSQNCNGIHNFTICSKFVGFWSYSTCYSSMLDNDSNKSQGVIIIGMWLKCIIMTSHLASYQKIHMIGVLVMHVFIVRTKLLQQWGFKHEFRARTWSNISTTLAIGVASCGIDKHTGSWMATIRSEGINSGVILSSNLMVQRALTLTKFAVPRPRCFAFAPHAKVASP